MTEADRRNWTAPGGARMEGLRRPDGKWLLRPPLGEPQAWPGLLRSAAADLVAPLLVNRPGDLGEAERTALSDAGFVPARTETLWRIPVASLPRLPGASRRDAAHGLVPVTDLDPEAVAVLDNEVRGDIPGAEAWAGTGADLVESLTDSEFDPELYLVARHRETGSLDGLIRVWNRTPTHVA